MRKIMLVPALALSLMAVPALAEESGQLSGTLENEWISAGQAGAKIADEGHDVRRLERHERGHEANDD